MGIEDSSDLLKFSRSKMDTYVFPATDNTVWFQITFDHQLLFFESFNIIMCFIKVVIKTENNMFSRSSLYNKNKQQLW